MRSAYDYGKRVVEELRPATKDLAEYVLGQVGETRREVADHGSKVARALSR